MFRKSVRIGRQGPQVRKIRVSVERQGSKIRKVEFHRTCTSSSYGPQVRKAARRGEGHDCESVSERCVTAAMMSRWRDPDSGKVP